jgi:PAS domain S-box-containing protein
MSGHTKNIRQQAEEKLAAQAIAAPPALPEDLERILHELRVHQIELEMQNEELRHAQRELDASRARYFDLYDLAPVGYFTLLEKGLILEPNLTLATLLGVARSELVAQPISRFISKDDEDAFYQFRRQLLSTSTTGLTPAGQDTAQSPCELRMVRGDGSLFWAELIASRVPDQDDKAELRVAVADITVRKRMEAEKAELEGQLIQALKMETVGRLAGGVAHDFNNMLMATMGYVELCQDGLPADHPMRCYLDGITKISQRSADLVRQLLAFARKQIIMPKVLDLNDTVGGMLTLLRRLIGEDIHMVWNPGAALWPVKLDPAQIDQILANLCINARDAITGGGEISISTANRRLDQTYCARHEGLTPGEYVMLMVSDTGCGMTKDILANIFEPFFTTKDVGKGTGLGLATVYGIVKQNQGGIDVVSEPRKGTTFTILLPRIGEGLQEVSAATAGHLPRGRGETILLVEDEPTLRMTCGRCLEHLGYKVLMAGTPAEALDVSARYTGDIHLLLSDIIMPGMNGRQLAEKLLASRKGLACLFMSGYTADVMDKAGAGEVNWPFLQKPFPRDDLARKIRELLDDRRALPPA